MHTGSKVKIFIVMVITISVIVIPQIVSIIWHTPLPSFLDAFYFLLFIVYSFPLFALNDIGVSGIITSNGNCGWGWCGPTMIGYLIITAFWIAALWIIACCISYFLKTKKL